MNPILALYNRKTVPELYTITWQNQFDKKKQSLCASSGGGIDLIENERIQAGFLISVFCFIHVNAMLCAVGYRMRT